MRFNSGKNQGNKAGWNIQSFLIHIKWYFWSTLSAYKSEPNKESTTTIEKVEERLSNCVTDRGDAVEDAFEVADTFESIHNSIQTLNSTLSDADS